MFKLLTFGIIFVLVVLAGLMFEVFIYYTGEIVIYVITLGKHKPRWDFLDYEKGSKYIINTDLSTIVGIIFWVVVIAILGFLFFR